MNNRFPKACRLAKRKEIRAVFARRDVFRGQRLHFYRGPAAAGESTKRNGSIEDSAEARQKNSLSRAANSEAPDRYCLMVGKKCGTAVRRNRIKRILREIIRHNRYRIPAGHDYVIRVDCNCLPKTGTITEKDFIDDFKAYFGWT